MEYTVSELITEVKVALDQNTSSTALSGLGDVDTLTLDEIIRSKLTDAARIVLESSPLEMLGQGRAFGDSVGWDMHRGYGSGHILLPDDFLRLLVFQMSDWSMAVTQPITDSDPRYAMQKSRFPGVRGCPQKPVVAIVKQPIGTVLEFYSCTQGEGVYIKMARYIPVPTIERVEVPGSAAQVEVIDLPPLLHRAVVYEAGRLVAVSIGDLEQAKKLEAVAAELAGVASVAAQAQPTGQA